MKHLVIVAGHAGVGKSTYAKSICQTNNLTLLDKDTLTQPLVESLMSHWMGEPHDRESVTYLDFVRPLEYTVLMDTAWQVLENGSSGVVLTAPFVKELYDEEWVQALEEKASELGYLLTILWVTCEPDLHKQQVIKRNAPRDQWKLENWDEWVRGLPGPPELDINYYVVMENTGSGFILRNID